MKSKYGLVLEGGGAKGAYHIGVYKALMEMGYHFSGVAGTSIGALNGALIAQGDWKKAWDLWFNVSNLSTYGINEEAFKSLGNGELKAENAIYAANVIADVIKSKGLDVEGLKKIYTRIFDEKKVRKSAMELGIVTVKIPEFKAVELFKEEIPEGELFSYLVASANFPVFNTRNRMEGNYVDGGFKNNLPLNMLPSKGITDLIAVRTFAPGFTKKFNNPDVNIFYIEPSKNLGSMFDFNREKSRKNLQLGYFDAYRSLKGYVGREFCIKPIREDFVHIEQLMKTADEKISFAAGVMGYEKINPRRFMFEKLLPQISEYLGLGMETSYEVVILRFFEEIALTLTMDRDKLYTANHFIYEVKRLFFLEHKNYSRYKTLPRIIQSSTFLSSFVKNDFFHFIMDIFFK